MSTLQSSEINTDFNTGLYYQSKLHTENIKSQNFYQLYKLQQDNNQQLTILGLNQHNQIVPVTASVIKSENKITDTSKWSYIQTDGSGTGFNNAILTNTQKVFVCDNDCKNIRLKKVDKLDATNKLVSWRNDSITGTYKDFLSGLLAGQAARLRYQSTGSKGRRNCYIELSSNLKTDKLTQWIGRLLMPILPFKKKQTSSNAVYRSKAELDLGELNKSISGKELDEFMRHPTDLGLAALYLQNSIYTPESEIISDSEIEDWDASFNTDIDFADYPLIIKAKPATDAEYVTNRIKEVYDADVLLDSNGNLLFTKSEAPKIWSRVAKYIPDVAAWTLPEEYRGKFELFNLQNKNKRVLSAVNLLDKHQATPRIIESAFPYRIEYQPVNKSDKITGVFIGSINDGILAKF